jgi:glucokinase
MILAGDIGGTKTVLALFEEERPGKPAVEETFKSREHESFDAIVETFVARHRPRVVHACIGVAGPVKHGRCEATNLPWVVDERDLAKDLGLSRAYLLNTSRPTPTASRSWRRRTSTS